MAELSEKKKGIAELLKKIPAETCWAITTKILQRFLVMRGEKIIAPALGKEEGITAPVLGAEKWREINMKIWSEGGAKLLQWAKETFNIPVEDAIGAANLAWVVGTLYMGPELTAERVEETPERVVERATKCPFWEMYKECEIDPAFIPCEADHQLFLEEGVKAINPKITCKLTKAMLRGDPYCEAVYEFKEE